MVSRLDSWRESPKAAIWFTVATSLLFVVIILVVNPNLLWMMVVLLPPIWSPVIAHRYFDGAAASQQPANRGIGVLLAGLAALLGLAVLLFFVA
jgi:hypothetical protein